jgi:hypothetical protein
MPLSGRMRVYSERSGIKYKTDIRLRRQELPSVQNYAKGSDPDARD